MLSTVFNQAGLSTTLYASSQSTLLRPQELDIYYEPPSTVPAEPGKPYPEVLYDNIRSVRKRVTGVFSGLLTTHEKVSETYSTTEGRVHGVYRRVLEDPYFLLKPGAIAIATAGGALMAGKGRKPVQRSLYALLFGVTASSVCYPERSVDIVTTGYHHTKSTISQLFSVGQTTTERVVEELKESEVVEQTKEDVLESIEVLEDTAVVQEEVDSKQEEGEEKVELVEDVTVSEEHEEKVEVVEEKPEVEEVLEPGVVTPPTEDAVETDRLFDEAEGFVVVDAVDAAPTEVGSQEIVAVETTEEDIVPADVASDNVGVVVEEAIPYDPNQIELKEVLPSPFDEPEVSKDVTADIEFEHTENIINTEEAEGDHGQSDPEDKDMYSTRS